MEPFAKKRRFSNGAPNSTKKEVLTQWQKCGDGFDDLLLNVPKRKISSARSILTRSTTPNSDRRKKFTDAFRRETIPPKTNQSISAYSSDEEDTGKNEHQFRMFGKDVKKCAQVRDVNNCAQVTGGVSQLSSTLPSIEDIESSGDVPESMKSKQENSYTYLSDEISDCEEESERPPSPVFGSDSQVLISSCSTETEGSGSGGGVGGGGGGNMKTSEWMKQLKWQNKTPEKSPETEQSVQLGDSAKKKGKLIKEGFADRMEKLIAREKSAVRFRAHRMSNKESSEADKTGILTVKVKTLREDHSHLMCECETCPESAHLLCNKSQQGTPLSQKTQQTSLVVIFNLAQAKSLSIGAGSTVHISPPWQKMCIPSISSAQSTTVILCTQFCKVDNSPTEDKSEPQKNAKITTTIEWSCPCLKGGVLKKNCKYELQPVLPSQYKQALTDDSMNQDSNVRHHSLSEVNSTTHTNTKLSAAPKIATLSAVQKGTHFSASSGNSILDSVERGGPTVSFKATVQRVLHQSTKQGSRHSLLLQDKEGTVCEVLLPGDQASLPGNNNAHLDQWRHLLECEGKEVQVSRLRVQQRVNSTRAPALFSMIESFWTQESIKKFSARRGYSQDSEDSNQPICVAQMPGFSYTFTISTEEGLIKPVNEAKPSPFYCDPLVMTCGEASVAQSKRVTLIAQLVYMLSGKAHSFYYVRDTSMRAAESGYICIRLKGSHVQAHTTLGNNYCFKDIFVEKEGHIYADGYSKVLTLGSLQNTPLAAPADMEQLKAFVRRPVAMPHLRTKAEPYELFNVKGFIDSVDEGTACSWLVCPKCDSDKLSGGTAENPFLYCDTCQSSVSAPQTKMHREVYLRSTEWENGATVKVQLKQGTIKKLLPTTVDDEGYEMSSVLNKEVGPISCVLLKSSASRSGGKSPFLEEIDIFKGNL